MTGENSPEQKGFWFFLYPFVHLSVTNKGVLIYNTFNGEMLEYQEITLIKLLREVDDWRNLYVIGLTNAELSPDILKMINDVRRTYSGDIIDFAQVEEKPIQFKPELKFFTTHDELTFNTGIPVLEKDEIGSYLKEATLFLNDNCSQKCINCSKTFKQMLYCTCSGKLMPDFSIESFKQLLNQFEETELEQLNITGANILKYEHLDEVTSILNQTLFNVDYHILLDNLCDNLPWYNKLGESPKNTLNVFISSQSEGNKVVAQCIETTSLLIRHGVDTVYHFNVQSDKELLDVEKLITDCNIEQFEIHPYFNGENIDFFRNNIFISKEALSEYKISMATIMARKKINNIAFQQLTILCNGEVYANLNHSKIGNIQKQSIFESLKKEMSNGNSWKRTRNSVSPCKNCPYNCLCPPISNYDYVIERFDLCNIYEPFISKEIE